MMLNTDPTCYMLVGPPCCGKSTFTNDFDWEIASTDNIIESWAKLEAKTYTEVWKEKFPAAEKAMYDYIDIWTGQKKNIIWDQTNLKPSAREFKMKHIPDTYHKVGVFFTNVDWDLLTQRNKEREKTGKFIPYDVINGMLSSYRNKIPKDVEPWFNTHIYVDSKTGAMHNEYWG